MNKDIILRLGLFASGIAIGVLGSRQYFKSQYEQLAQEDLQSRFEREKNIEEHAIQIGAELERNMIGAEEALDRYNPYGDIARSSLNGTRTSRIDASKTNYNLKSMVPPDNRMEGEPYQFEEPYEDDEEPLNGGELTDSAGKTEAEMTSSFDSDDPYVISSVDFERNPLAHEQVTLYYYTVDDVLCDEDEVIISNIDDTVGWDCFKLFDVQTTAWVRNEMFETDYEIIAIKQSFAESIHGIPTDEIMSPRERYLKQQRGDERDDE